MKTTFTASEINPLAAYQFGRVDALLGDEPTRFSAEPYTGSESTPDFHCKVTEAEAEAWSEIRAEYAKGYASQKSQILKPAVKAY